MDCSKTEVFLSEIGRLCNSVGDCEKCVLECQCMTAYRSYPILDEHEIEFVINAVQEWSDAHQPKTRLSVLKEAFPNAKYCKDGQPEACAEDLFGISCPIYEKDYIADNECEKCWNTPIEDDNNA